MAAFQPLTRLGRPAEAHGVDTPDAYRAFQAALIAENRRRRPMIAWRDPFVHAATDLVPFVSGGRWVVLCRDCRNAPLYDPDWQLACCPECGAIYQGIAPPADATAIEETLMARPDAATRHWIGDPDAAAFLRLADVDTLQTLVDDNVTNGDAVPDAAAAALKSDAKVQP